MLIDTHAHLNFNAYKDDAQDVIKRTLDGNVWMLNVGTNYQTSKKAVEMAQKYEKGVYAAVGLHPIHVQDESFSYDLYKKLAQSERVVAIGECGLDYFHKPYSEEKQKEVFLQHLNLAEELKLPVIVHCRFAHDDLITTLEQYNNRTIQGVVHCFTGTWKQAQEYLAMGLYLGFNGIIFKTKIAETSSHLSPRAVSSRSALDDIIRKTPLEKILIETDCPYLTPSPAVALAKAGRNEPLFIKYVVQKIAELKGETFEKISEITTQNAKTLFSI